MTREEAMTDADKIAAIAADLDSIATVLGDKQPQARLMYRRAVASLWEAFGFIEAGAMAYQPEKPR